MTFTTNATSVLVGGLNHCSNGTVIPLLPRWPTVRCNTCHRLFELSTMPRTCPTCGGTRFTTRMDGLPVEMDEG